MIGFLHTKLRIFIFIHILITFIQTFSALFSMFFIVFFYLIEIWHHISEEENLAVQKKLIVTFGDS